MKRDKTRYRLGVDLTLEGSRGVRKRVLHFLLSAALTALVVVVVVYLAFSLFVSTDVEGRLKRENKLFEKLYPQLEPQVELLEDAVEHIQEKDNRIYGEIFNSPAPTVNPIETLASHFDSDTLSQSQIVADAYRMGAELSKEVSSVEQSLIQALIKVAASENVLPPMLLPVKNVSFTQVGASVGDKLNPFLKVYADHGGLDFILPIGEPVYAPGPGTVTLADKNHRSWGNCIEISHPGGYKTCYHHLASISVRRGQKVAAGTKIGSVGATGHSFAPHLHYEMYKDGIRLNPINYIFGSVSADEYSNMLYMTVNTQQSMD